MGLQVLVTVSDAAAEHLVPHLPFLLDLFSKTLQEVNTLTGYYSVQSLTYFVPFVNSAHIVSTVIGF